MTCFGSGGVVGPSEVDESRWTGFRCEIQMQESEIRIYVFQWREYVVLYILAVFERWVAN